MKVSFSGLHYFKNYKSDKSIKETAEFLHIADGGDIAKNPLTLSSLDSFDKLFVTSNHIEPTERLINLLAESFEPKTKDINVKGIITQSIIKSFAKRNDCIIMDCKWIRPKKRDDIAFKGNYKLNNLTADNKEIELLAQKFALNDCPQTPQKYSINGYAKKKSREGNFIILTGKDVDFNKSTEKKYQHLFNFKLKEKKANSDQSKNHLTFVINMINNYFGEKSNCIEINCENLKLKPSL